jgi:hypothetical protein
MQQQPGTSSDVVDEARVPVVFVWLGPMPGSGDANDWDLARNWLDPRTGVRSLQAPASGILETGARVQDR